jgi:hypothetical protein
VRVDLGGRRIIKKQAYTRQLAGFCVDVCNENGWVIPFTQLTLHVAPPESSGAEPTPSPNTPPSASSLADIIPTTD